MSNSVRPHRRQPTRLLRPWDSPGKNTGAGCHFLLQYISLGVPIKEIVFRNKWCELLFDFLKRDFQTCKRKLSLSWSFWNWGGEKKEGKETMPPYLQLLVTLVSVNVSKHFNIVPHVGVLGLVYTFGSQLGDFASMAHLSMSKDTCLMVVTIEGGAPGI